MSSNQEFTVRETQPGDGEALNELYRRVTGTSRTLAQWRWEWFEGPLGPAPSWVIVDSSSGHIVGHHGVVPVPLMYRGQRLKAARTENTMIDPDARRRLVYPPIEARLLSKLLQRFDVIFTTSGKGSHGLVRKRLGYRTVGTWRTFTVGLTPYYIASRIAGPTIGRLLSPLGSAICKPKANWQLEETADVAGIAAACKSWAALDAVVPERTDSYLRWRLAAHPYHKIQLGLLKRGHDVIAFLAWHEIAGDNGAREIQIDDICARKDDIDTFAAAFAALTATYRNKAARVTLRTLDNGRPLARASALRKLLNRANAEGAELLVRCRDDLKDVPWDATMLLAEGI